MTKTTTHVLTTLAADSPFRGSPYEVAETAGASVSVVVCGVEHVVPSASAMGGTVVEMPIVPDWVVPANVE